jgi:hypothetical protein
MAFVSEGALWVVPVDEGGGATAPPQAIAVDQPESPSWEGDSRHIVYQTPRGLRRVIADGGLPDAIPLDLSWRNAATPERLVVHAGRCARQRAGSDARRVGHRDRIRASSGASKRITTNCTRGPSWTRRASM